MTSESARQPWFRFPEAVSVPSPGLLVYRDRVEENLRRMLALAGSAGRLRPHIKTHKMREVIEMQLALGITKFKCATIAEAELAALVGVPDLLLAYQPVGPNQHRVAELARSFPRTKFSVICDDALVIRQLSEALESLRLAGRGQMGAEAPLEVLLDICPTVALHAEALVVAGGKAAGSWKVAARDRRLNI